MAKKKKAAKKAAKKSVKKKPAKRVREDAVQIAARVFGSITSPSPVEEREELH